MTNLKREPEYTARGASSKAFPVVRFPVMRFSVMRFSVVRFRLGGFGRAGERRPSAAASCGVSQNGFINARRISSLYVRPEGTR